MYIKYTKEYVTIICLGDLSWVARAFQFLLCKRACERTDKGREPAQYPANNILVSGYHLKLN